MNTCHFLPVITLGLLTILPFHRATAENDSFLTALLRFTGITVTPSTVRGSEGFFMTGDIWLVQLGEAQISEPRKITSAGTYHTPLWIPGEQSILAMKEGRLIRLNPDGKEEETLHTLKDNTELLGFDRTNSNFTLVLQDSIVGILSVKSGQITPLSYDKEKDRYRVDQLRSDFRDYGTTQVSIENKDIKDSQGHFKKVNTIHINLGNKDIQIACPSACSQPALKEDGRQLLFIGQ